MTTQIWNADLLRTNFEYSVEDNTVTIQYGTKAEKGEPLAVIDEVTFSGDEIDEDTRKMVFLQGLGKLIGNKRAKTGIVWGSADAGALREAYDDAFARLKDGTYWNRASGEGKALGSSEFLQAIKLVYADLGKEFVQDDFEAKYGRTAKSATDEQKQAREDAAKNERIVAALLQIKLAKAGKGKAAKDKDL